MGVSNFFIGDFQIEKYDVRDSLGKLDGLLGTC